MNKLVGEAEAGERLKKTALRDFGPPMEGDNKADVGWYRTALSRDDVPVPALLSYALKLIGLDADGPGEKVEWWVDFTYRGEQCKLASEKFGVRLYLQTEASDADARVKQAQIAKQLRSSIHTVEKLILAAAPDLLATGNATVVNQHLSLRRAYEYFRRRAVDPAVIEDEITVEVVSGGTFTSFTHGKSQMSMNAFHDMVAAISAYLSLLEHDFVLALAFSDFEPAKENLTEVIGSRWGLKFERLLGKVGDAGRYRQRLAEVVERWRNPYSHGGFEKGHGATIYLHAPGVGAAVPVGLTKVRSSPLFSFLPTSETDIAEVFDLFDEIDSWLKTQLPEATQWIDAGLNVRFDEAFRVRFGETRAKDDFDDFLRAYEYQQEMNDNMDY